MFSHVDFLGFQIGLITGLLLLSGGVILSKAGLIGGSNRNDLADSIQHLRTDNNVQRLETKAEKEEEDADLGIGALHDDDDDSDSTISSQSDRLELAEDHLEDEAGMASKEQVEESNDEIWKRVHIEEALSAELIRQCPNCLVAIVRETGCNMMVCSFCYAKMCYVCKKPIQGYSHFRSQFKQDSSKCPFYTADDELHTKNVVKAGTLAKEEADRDQPYVELKHNPLEDFSHENSSSSSSED